MEGDVEPSFCELVSGMAEGTLVDDKYAIEGVLGVGGMGAVLAATHLELELPVAIKVVRPELEGEPSIVARLLCEGHAAAQIRSEHVTRVLDVGRLPRGAPYVVMERLEGLSLDRVLELRGPLPLAETVDAVVEACEALADAHAAGIVHRDLKPANLFLARRHDGTELVKLLDFGISKSPRARRERSLTDPHLALGSPSYMAPEQVKAAGDLDAGADIWALGAILFELLTGRMLYEETDTAVLQASILLEEPPALRAHRPDLPRAVDRAVRRCLMKDRRARHPDVAALASELAPFGSERSRASLQRIARVHALPLPLPHAPATFASQSARLRWAGAAAALAAATSLVVFAVAARPAPLERAAPALADTVEAASGAALSRPLPEPVVTAEPTVAAIDLHPIEAALPPPRPRPAAASEPERRPLWARPRPRVYDFHPQAP